MRDAFDKLQGKKGTVFGLSTDSVETQRKFWEANQLPYDLISDPEGKLAEKLGVPLLLGKFTSRRAYLFKDGSLVWKDEEGATGTQGEDVLAAMRRG